MFEISWFLSVGVWFHVEVRCWLGKKFSTGTFSCWTCALVVPLALPICAFENKSHGLTWVNEHWTVTFKKLSTEKQSTILPIVALWQAA